LDIQAHIPVALSAIHNFIRTHEPGDEPPLVNPDILANDNFNEDPAAGIVEHGEADVRRDKISQDMWDDYQHVRDERGAADTDDEAEDTDDEAEDSDDEEPYLSDECEDNDD
jgi:hypothetical protein